MNRYDFNKAKSKFNVEECNNALKDLLRERKQFIKYFNIRKLSGMKMDEYVIGKDHDISNFCYAVERQFDGLGRILGTSSAKFGVWYSTSQKKYCFTKRFGSNLKEAFGNVRQAIIKLIQAGEQENLEAIEENPLSPMFKGKILFLYYPDYYLNIFSDTHLDYYLRFFNLDNEELMGKDAVYKREALLDFKNSDKTMKSWTNYQFSYFLYTDYPKSPTSTELNSKDNPQTPQEISFVDLESKSIDKTKKQPAINKNHDYESEQRRSKEIGNRGEKIVVDKEKEMLCKWKIIKDVEWSAKEKGDGLGYDVLSYYPDGREHYIEVKATTKKIGEFSFFLTENERLFAEKHPDDYSIYAVFEVNSSHPKIWDMKNPLNSIELEPIQYKINIAVTNK